MHRFQPRIYLVIRPEGVNGPITDIEKEKYRTYVFPETVFTAVTAYQNQLVRIQSLSFCRDQRLRSQPEFNRNARVLVKAY